MSYVTQPSSPTPTSDWSAQVGSVRRHGDRLSRDNRVQLRNQIAEDVNALVNTQIFQTTAQTILGIPEGERSNTFDVDIQILDGSISIKNKSDTSWQILSSFNSSGVDSAHPGIQRACLSILQKAYAIAPISSPLSIEEDGDDMPTSTHDRATSPASPSTSSGVNTATTPSNSSDSSGLSSEELNSSDSDSDGRRTSRRHSSSRRSTRRRRHATRRDFHTSHRRHSSRSHDHIRDRARASRHRTRDVPRDIDSGSDSSLSSFTSSDSSRRSHRQSRRFDRSRSHTRRFAATSHSSLSRTLRELQRSVDDQQRIIDELQSELARDAGNTRGHSRSGHRHSHSHPHSSHARRHPSRRDSRHRHSSSDHVSSPTLASRRGRAPLSVAVTSDSDLSSFGTASNRSPVYAPPHVTTRTTRQASSNNSSGSRRRRRHSGNSSRRDRHTTPHSPVRSSNSDGSHGSHGSHDRGRTHRRRARINLDSSLSRHSSRSTRSSRVAAAPVASPIPSPIALPPRPPRVTFRSRVRPQPVSTARDRRLNTVGLSRISAFQRIVRDRQNRARNERDLARAVSLRARLSRLREQRDALDSAVRASRARNASHSSLSSRRVDHISGT